MEKEAPNAMQVQVEQNVIVEEDDDGQGIENENGEQENICCARKLKKRKIQALRSPHWTGYTRCMVLEGVPPKKKQKGRCHTCNMLIAADPKRNGTTALKNHKISCSRRKAEATGQALLSFQPGAAANDGSGPSGALVSWKFNQLEIRLSLCEMIMLDELSFRFVEKEGFRKFVAKACPMFQIPCRKTVGTDCVQLFLERKEGLRSFFKKQGMGKVSLTSDCWTAINNTSFICVTAHFISKNWVLHKKIISFKKIVSHKGEDVGDSIIISLEDWDMKSILCCTLDNASSNDGAVRFLRDRLDMWGTGILGGKYLHMRCAAHIINLVVSDGLDEIGLSVRRVREAVKWITGSPPREDQFNTCVMLLKINCKKSMSLDVPTRWNSTYLMLEAAKPYEAAIKLYEGMNSLFVTDLKNKKYKNEPIGTPEASDWMNVRKIMEYLKKFFDMTRLVSGTAYVTVHLFFKEMCDIFDLITDLEHNEDKEISAMARKMKAKVGKYWLETEEINPKLNKILYIAALLDPRQKMKHVEKCLKMVYKADRATQLVKDVKDSIGEMFELYKKNLSPIPTPKGFTSQASTSTSQNRRLVRRGTCSTMRDSSDDECDNSDTSELTLYFAEKRHKELAGDGNETDVVDKFDILKWWSTHGLRFPILSMIAKDILAVPISSVASVSAFSTGGRVLDAFRSSLSPKTVEALICSEDWLRSSASFKSDEVDLTEKEQDEEYQKVLASIAINSNQNVEGTTTTGTISAGSGTKSIV